MIYQWSPARRPVLEMLTDDQVLYLNITMIGIFVVEQLSLSLEEAKDELQVTKRKNNAAIKVTFL